MEKNMRIKNLKLKEGMDRDDYAWHRELQNQQKEEKESKAGILKKIKDAIAKLKASYKFKIDVPDDGHDDSDLKKYSSDGVKPNTDPAEQNIQKNTQLSWDPKDAVDLYKSGKPYFKYRVWNPVEDKNFITYVVDKVKKMLGDDSEGVTPENVKLAFESIRDKKDRNALYESYLTTTGNKEILFGQTIKLKELLK